MLLRLFCGAAFVIGLSACTESNPEVIPITTVVTVAVSGNTPTPTTPPTPTKPGSAAPKPVPAPVVSEPAKPTKPVTPQQPAVPAKTPEPNPAPTNPAPTNPAPTNPAPTNPVAPEQPSVPVKATDVYLNHFCLLSDHSNLCSRTSMHPDWPGHSLKLEPINNSGKTLTGTLVIEYDASKIEPAADGNLRHSVKHSTIRFEKSLGRLMIKKFVIQPGQDYQYLWNRIKPNASGTVRGKATFTWQQDNQTRYAMGCYEFNIGSQGGNDNIQGLEKGKFNGHGGMDCGAPSIPD
jgi:hypothetical protein